MTQVKKKKKVRFTVLGIFFISILLVALISLTPAQAIFEPGDNLSNEVVLNKPEISYDLSPLEEYVNKGTVNKIEQVPIIGRSIYQDESNIDEELISEPGDSPIDDFQKSYIYLYRSHYNRDLAVVIQEVYGSIGIYDYKALSVKLEIPSEQNETSMDWERVVLEFNRSIVTDISIKEFLENKGYFEFGYGIETKNFTELEFVKDYYRITILSGTQYIDEGEPGLPLGALPTSITIEGPKDKLNESVKPDILELVSALNLDSSSWDSAYWIHYPNLIFIDKPTVSISPNTFDWPAAFEEELKWLKNEKIITNITNQDIQSITGIFKDTRNQKIEKVFYNNTWQLELKSWGPLESFISTIDEYDLPDGVPGIGPSIRQEGIPYLAFAAVAIVFIILVTFGYTRLKRRSILDNLNRKNIFELVKGNQGIHFKKILRELDFKPGALSYHLNVLEKEEYIKSIQDGNLRRFYLYGTKSDLKIALTSIQLRILSIVDERPGITQSSISKNIGTNRMLVNYHIKILTDAGILSLERSGRESHCYTTDNAEYYLTG